MTAGFRAHAYPDKERIPPHDLDGGVPGRGAGCVGVFVGVGDSRFANNLPTSSTLFGRYSIFISFLCNSQLLNKFVRLHTYHFNESGSLWLWTMMPIDKMHKGK